MKLNHKIKIDLKDFISIGRFDHLKLGMSKDKVLQVFPQPDYWSEDKKSFKDEIWVYGNFELHFYRERLFMIFNDYLDCMEGGELLEIDHWIFKRKQKFKLPEFINVLISEKIDFTKKTNNLDQVILRITETAVQVQFDKSNEQEDMIDAIEDKKKSKVAERELDPIEFVMSCICIFDNNYIQIKL